MLRTFGDSRGYRTIIIGVLAGVTALALAVDPADARGRRRHSSHAKHGGGYNPPYSAIVVDANSGNVLHAAEADGIRHPASLTKIMTLFLLFERLDAGKIALDTEMKVSKHASEQSPTKLGLRPGQTIAVEDAIKGLVTRSANDAAVVIAETIAGDEDDFAKLMTRKARALGMSRTVYKNASGLPDNEQVTTARDQATLGRAIQERFPKYYRYFSTRSFTFRGNSIGNHNHLLGSVEGVDGIKTGFTTASGFNLVTSMKRDHRYLVAVVLGGKSGGARDARMRSLLDKYVSEASTRRTAPMIAEKETTEPITIAAVEETPEAPAAESRTSESRTSESRASESRSSESRNSDSRNSDATPAPARPIPASARSTTRHAEPVTTAAVPIAKTSADPIRPIAVRTIKVKLSGPQTASLTPPLVHMPAATKPQHFAAAAPIAAAAAAPVTVIAPAAAEAPAAAPVAVRAPVQVAAAGDDAIAIAAPSPDSHKATHSGWIIQVGAFEAERDAKNRLVSAQSKAKHLLSHADPFTETVVKDSKTFYRARFAGFEKQEAEAACKYLKRNDFACMTLKN